MKLLFIADCETCTLRFIYFAVSAEDHSDYDCLVVAILTHGEEGLLFASDSAYKHEQVFDNFRGDKCPSLVGKPKIFFIQVTNFI